MQIRMVTGNRFNTVVGGTMQAKSQQARSSISAFNSAQCRVTISKEGRKLSEQAAERQTSKDAQSLKAEKTMLRQQEQPNEADETKNEYLALLEEIDKTMKSINSATRAGGDDVTAEKKQQLIRQMREQKQRQIEQNQKKAKEAEQMALQSSEAQDEVDRNNRELYVMLKSLEESEKAEEEAEEKGSGSAESTGSGGIKTENSVDDIIQNSATQFTVSSAKRELDVLGMIDALSEEGHAYIDKADEIVQKAAKESDDLKKILAADDWTDAEKEEAVLRYRDKVTESYKELRDYKRRGLQMIQDAKDCKLQHIADNPLDGMEETKESMLNSAVDAAINEATQGKLDETSQDLEDAVEELIDRRNDTDHVEPEEEEEKQEQELLLKDGAQNAESDDSGAAKITITDKQL